MRMGQCIYLLTTYTAPGVCVASLRTRDTQPEIRGSRPAVKGKSAGIGFLICQQICSAFALPGPVRHRLSRARSSALDTYPNTKTSIFRPSVSQNIHTTKNLK